MVFCCGGRANYGLTDCYFIPQSASPYSYKPYYYFTNTFFTEPLLYLTTLMPLVGVSIRLPFVVYR